MSRQIEVLPPDNRKEIRNTDLATIRWSDLIFKKLPFDEKLWERIASEFNLQGKVSPHIIVSAERLDESLHCQFNGEMIDFDAVHYAQRSSAGANDLCKESYVFCVKNPDDQISIAWRAITFSYKEFSKFAGLFFRHELPIVESVVQKNPLYKNEPKWRGLGQTLIRQSLVWYEDLEKQGKKFIARIYHDTNLGLTEEKWMAIYEPFLTESGFENDGNGKWEKTYGEKN
jgi:hypothetical protein